MFVLPQTTFPADLKSWRKAVGLKQDALAYLLGVTQPAISRWESGLDHPSVAVQLRLRDMMCPMGTARLKIDDFVLRQKSALEALFHLGCVDV